MFLENKFTGCFIGLAIGDAYGASYEGGIMERLLWKLIGNTSEGKRRYTDDTQMSIDIAQSYLEHAGIVQDHLALKFTSSYKWSRGYGPSAARLLQGISKGQDWRKLNRKKFQDGSLGNGAAMRAPIVALCHPYNDNTLDHLIQQSAEITHTHPLAIEGAHAIAIATCMALKDAPTDNIVQTMLSKSNSAIYRSKLNTCSDFLISENVIENKLIKQKLGNGILATESCITAIYFALKYRESEFEQMLKAIFSLGGDTDTIAAMAGGIWGACNGVKNLTSLAEEVENISMIESLAIQLYKQHLTINW